MSSDLHVKLTQSVKVAELLIATEVTMKELLAVPAVPHLSIEEMDKGVRQPIMTDEIAQSCPMFLIGLEGFDEVVGIVVTEIPRCPPFVTDEEAGLYAGITVSAMRTPLEFALAASVAIALARISNTTVIDDGTRWSSILEQPPEDFAKAIAVSGSFDNIVSSAQAMYAATIATQKH